MKTEPSVYSIEDLKNSKEQKTCWEGVRNYQARNFMRDEMKLGDKVIFYHSNTKPPAAVAVCEVCKESYPDFTAFDKNSKYYDPKSKKDSPVWFMVDLKFVEEFSNYVSLDAMKKMEELQSMKLLQKGNRLSVMPITKKEFEIIVNEGKKSNFKS